MIKLRYLAENRPKHTVKIAVSVTTLIEHQITSIPRSARQDVEKRSFADASNTVNDSVQPLVLQSGNQHAQRPTTAGDTPTLHDRQGRRKHTAETKPPPAKSPTTFPTNHTP